MIQWIAKTTQLKNNLPEAVILSESTPQTLVTINDATHGRTLNNKP